MRYIHLMKDGSKNWFYRSSPGLENNDLSASPIRHYSWDCHIARSSSTTLLLGLTST